MGRCSHQQFFSPISTTIILPWILQMILLAFWWNTSACMPARQRTVLKWNLFRWGPPGKSHFWFDKNRLMKQEREREGTALHEVCCRAMLKIHTKFFFGLGGGVDPHQIAVTLNWIFNVSAEPVIEFLLSVAHDIYQKSATTNQNQQQPWWNCGFFCFYTVTYYLNPLSQKGNTGQLYKKKKYIQFT